MRWTQKNEQLFVDPSPEIPGQKHLFWYHPGPIAYHMPNPTLEQAYLFGYHRALKVVQKGRTRKNTEQANQQWSLLKDVWYAYQKSKDKIRFIILCGAEEVFDKRPFSLDNKFKTDVNSIERKLSYNSQQRAFNSLANKWEDNRWISFIRYIRYIKLPTFVNFFIKLTSKIKQKTIKVLGPLKPS